MPILSRIFHGFVSTRWIENDKFKGKNAVRGVNYVGNDYNDYSCLIGYNSWYAKATARLSYQFRGDASTDFDW